MELRDKNAISFFRVVGKTESTHVWVVLEHRLCYVYVYKMHFQQIGVGGLGGIPVISYQWLLYRGHCASSLMTTSSLTYRKVRQFKSMYRLFRFAKFWLRKFN